MCAGARTFGAQGAQKLAGCQRVQGRLARGHAETWQVCAGQGRNDMQRAGKCSRLQGRFPAVPPGKRRHAANFWMSLRGAKRRGNPYSLRQRKTKSNTLGESEKRYEFALRITNLQSFSAGMRIATSRGGCPAPRNDMQKEGRVRGCKDVVRNDMLKTGRCARGQGPAAGSVKTGPSPREITKKYRAVSP